MCSFKNSIFYSYMLFEELRGMAPIEFWACKVVVGIWILTGYRKYVYLKTDIYLAEYHLFDIAIVFVLLELELTCNNLFVGQRGLNY